MTKKITQMNSLRSKILQINNKLQYIDFNVNASLNKDHELKLNINHYLSQRKIKNNKSRNPESRNKIESQLSEDFKNNSDIIVNINKSQCPNKKNNLYLPHITTNIIRKGKNMRH